MNDPRTWGQLDLLARTGNAGPGVPTYVDAIGAGALDTYRAFDRVLQREVVLHLLPSGIDTEAGDQALERARRFASVRHPRVVAVHGVERHDDRLGVWMERVEGRSLEDWSRESAPVSAIEIVATGVDLSLALHALHSAGLSHGQLRASSALRDSNGRVLLTDIGQGGASGSLEQDIANDLESLGKLLLDLALATSEPDLALATNAPDLALETNQSDLAFTTNTLVNEPNSAKRHDTTTAEALAVHRPDLPPVLCHLLELLLDASAPLRPHSAVATSLWLSACVDSELSLELPPLGLNPSAPYRARRRA